MKSRALPIWLYFCGACWPASALAHDPIRAQFTTADGVAIVGDYWTPIEMGKPAPVVILLHMYNSDREAWTPLIPALEEAGLAILAIDLRGHGASLQPEERKLAQKVKQRDPDLFRNMYKDVLGAYEWLRRRSEVDLSRIALVGASVGCSVALDYAGRDKSVDVLVLMTPGKDYLGLDSMKHIKDYGDRPMLMLTSEEEKDKGASALAELAARSQLKVYTETGIHGTQMFGKVADVNKDIGEFLKTAVGPASDELVYASVNGEVYHAAGSHTLKQIKPENLRVFSSAAEAEQRGLRRSKR